MLSPRRSSDPTGQCASPGSTMNHDPAQAPSDEQTGIRGWASGDRKPENGQMPLTHSGRIVQNILGRSSLQNMTNSLKSTPLGGKSPSIPHGAFAQARHFSINNPLMAEQLEITIAPGPSHSWLWLQGHVLREVGGNLPATFCGTRDVN
ncbi:hypothetical protein AN958_01946 [Leucoagaricus sp. SymC.cos]|nr:hypothetical protein AN958_01946 [Leucoagaricus sp. SymC.cos]